MRSWARFAISSLTLLGGLAACTFITNETSTQCRNQEDCLSRGPEFADTTCSIDRVCVKIEAAETACTTNQQCIDENGGAPYTCRRSDGKCVSLLSTNCQTVYADKEDLIDDNLVVVGTTLPFDENGRQAGFAVNLARQEIKRGGGLAAATPGGPRRPLAVVSCVGEHQSLASGLSMFNHLADTVQVPYISGPFTSQLMTRGLDIFISHNIMAMTQNSMIAIAEAADNDLIFRVNFGDDMFVQTFNAFLANYLEESIRTDAYCNNHPNPDCVPFNLAPGEPLRVGLMATVDQPGQAVTEAIGKYLRFNGKSVTENLADGNFAIFNVGNPADPIGHPYPEGERNQGIAQAIAFKPHVIMYVGTPIDASVLGGDLGWLALNRAWPTGPGAPARPYGAMIIAGWAGPVIPLVGQSQGLGPETRHKFFGMRGLAYGWNPQDFQTWVQGLKLAAPELKDAAVVPLAAMSYDRIYLFSYALAAIGNAPVRGPELARGLRKVAGAAGGTTIKWGPADYPKALQELAAGKNLSYVGADGNYTFDDAGQRPGFGDVYCVPLVKGAIAGPQASGFSYDPSTDKVNVIGDPTKLPQTAKPNGVNMGACVDTPAP